jgi:hypothetical protein
MQMSLIKYTSFCINQSDSLSKNCSGGGTKRRDLEDTLVINELTDFNS